MRKDILRALRVSLVLNRRNFPRLIYTGRASVRVAMRFQQVERHVACLRGWTMHSLSSALKRGLAILTFSTFPPAQIASRGNCF